MPNAPRPAMSFEITPRTLLVALAIFAGAWLAVQLWFVGVLVAIALVLAGTLYPLVSWLERHRVRRSLALLLIFLLLSVVVALVFLLIVPPLVSDLMSMAERLPALQTSVAEQMRSSRLLRGVASSVKNLRVSDFLTGVAASAVELGSQIVLFVGEAVTVLFLALYILAEREREQAALFAVVPRRYHLRLARILLNLQTIVGGYVRGQIITSVAIAVFTFALLAVLGVENALPLAVFAGLTDVIPFVGGLIAGTPVVLGALQKSVPTALVVLVLFVVYQEFESRLLVPRVYGRVLRLSPAWVIVALLIGGTLLGVLGALLALPVAAGVRMMVVELRVELPGDDSPDEALRARDEAAEREFAQRTAGAAPAAAAAIATRMAKDIRESDAPGEPEKAAEVPVTGGQDDTKKG